MIEFQNFQFSVYSARVRYIDLIIHLKEIEKLYFMYESNSRETSTSKTQLDL